MNRKFFIAIILASMSLAAFSQKYITKNGMIKFYSEAPMETIEAINKQVNCAFDTETGDMVFKVLIKAFEFEKALMQEHFNENYMYSDKYPNATFVGKVKDWDAGQLNEGMAMEVVVEGDLTIKGVKNKVSETGTLEIQEGKILAKTLFPVKLSDYEVKIPKTVIDNIAETVEITVDLALEKYQK
jgi:polyisoprenoid-binding protein YceI